jgi:hypothetical protein
MALVNKIFWGLAAVEAVFFVVAFVITATASGPNPDGGRGMALIFQIALPFLILGVVSLIYWKTNSAALHIILLIVVIVPVVVLAGQWMRGPLMDRDIAVGGYLYKDPAMKKFVAAIANLNTGAVRELAPRIDVNAPGENGVTPLKFAIEKVDSPGTVPEQLAARLEMIRVLLSLGAKPDSALPIACGANHEEITGILLDAGANPNYKDEEGTPAFFFCGAGSSGGLQGLRLFAQKGTDFNALDAKGESALIRAATFSKWELMLFFLEQGVKDTPSPRGKTAASMVAGAIAEDKQNSRETAPALRQLDSKLNR